MDSYDRAILIQPDYAQAHYNRHALLLNPNDLMPAIKCMEKAIDIDPLDTQFRFILGMLWDYSGDVQQATAHFDIVENGSNLSFSFSENVSAMEGILDGPVLTLSFLPDANGLGSVTVSASDVTTSVPSSSAKTQGGIVVVSEGKILASMPLQMAGIISTNSFETVSENFENLNTVLADAGCRFKKPHLIPLFLPFLALPDIRILSTGLIDVKNRSFLSVVT